jgi:acid phosphatase
LAALALASAACASAAAPVLTPPAVPSAAPSPEQRRVFLIVMENHSAAEALTGAFTAALAARSGEAADYHAITHPSVPNYLALESGATWGVTDDSYHSLPPADLGHQLTAASVPWRAYMEGLGPQACLRTPLPYDPGHNPFLFFGGGCPPNVIPFTKFAADVSGPSAPRFLWITPDICHDEHSCSIGTGDGWLRSTVAEIRASAAWTAGAVLFVTWDDDDGSAGNNVLTLVVTPRGGHRVSHKAYDHYSLLATIEDLLGVPRLAHAGPAAPLTDLVSGG